MPSYETPTTDVQYPDLTFGSSPSGQLSVAFQEPQYGYLQFISSEPLFSQGITNNPRHASDSDFYTLGTLQAGTSGTFYVGGALTEQLQVGIAYDYFTDDQTFAEGDGLNPDGSGPVALYPTTGQGIDVLQVNYTAPATAEYILLIQDIGDFVDSSVPYVITTDQSLAADLTASFQGGDSTIPSDTDPQQPGPADTIEGSGQGEDLAGGGADEVIKGLGGADRILGRAGNDQVYGNQGADQIYGNAGDDFVFGGQGNDFVFGGQGIDEVYGNLGADEIYGNKGNDLLFGGQDDDLLFGGEGNDQLFGNKGDDSLWGNLGDDVMNGGTGADEFVLNGGGSDRIQDFDASEGDRFGHFSGFDRFELADVPDGLEVDWQAGSDSGQVILEGLDRADFDNSWLL
jgi:Ca2+-binding RTX toxin-like protein